MSDAPTDASEAGSPEGSTAGGTGTERLLRRNNWAAGIGLVLSVATLAFTVFFHHLLRKQATVLAPGARVAAQLDADINQSIAALRGYVAYGDPHFVAERRAVWARIDRSLDAFDTIIQNEIPPEDRPDYEEFRRLINELRYTQWAIEDVAHTPGNVPALSDYRRHVRPIRDNVMRAFAEAALAVQAEAHDDPDLLFLLAAYYAHFVNTDATLETFVNEPTANHLAAYDNHIEGLTQAAQMIDAHVYGLDQQRQDSAMVNIALLLSTESAAYRARADALRNADGHQRTVAQTLFTSRALPLARFVSARMRFVATVQAMVSERSSRIFSVLGLGIIACALLLGLLSATSLFMSYRIRSRVDRVLERTRKLGQYAIERRLGAGGMGEVYLARHAMLRRPAAVKLLRSERRASRRARERFQNEVRLTSRLTHPNTVAIFDYGRTPDGVFYYAMEYLDGPTLQQLIDSTGPMGSARAIHILVQVAGALAEAHEAGLLHRDVKPSNIMLCRLGGVADTAKVLDFGLVQELTDDAHGDEGALEGTPLYLAPESILDAQGSEVRSDLYALGAVGYYLVSGRPPFVGETTLDVLSAHLTETPRHPDRYAEDGGGTRVDPDLSALLLACLAKDPAERPATAQEVAARLRACTSYSDWDEAAREAWWSEYGEVIESAIRGEEDEVGSSLENGLAVRIGLRTSGTSGR
ncbi:MAG: protein kinase [Sandaracinaceae bacterium]